MPPEPHALFASWAFEQHGSAVHRYFRRLTGDRCAADDLTQEVFLRVVRSAANYQPIERERAWIFRIARNVFLDDRRRERTAPAIVPVSTQRLAAPTQAVSLSLREGLDRLSPEDCDALLLAEVGGLTYTEIAQALRTTVPAVRNRIYRARLALRETLAAPAPEIDAAHLRHDDD